MMRAIRIILCVSAIVATTALVANAEEKHAPPQTIKNAQFDKIKALSGVWEFASNPGEHAAEHAMPGGTVSYRVTAGGSAVVEDLGVGTDHEMVTLYYVDGHGLALTHYCVLGNRPHMQAEPSSSPDKIVFKCHERENSAIEAEDHMHQVTFTFVDPDHIKSEWVLYKGGKPDSTHAFSLVRKKK